MKFKKYKEPVTMTRKRLRLLIRYCELDGDAIALAKEENITKQGIYQLIGLAFCSIYGKREANDFKKCSKKTLRSYYMDTNIWTKMFKYAQYTWHNNH